MAACWIIPYSRAVRLGEDDNVVTLDLLLHEIHGVHRPAGDRAGEKRGTKCCHPKIKACSLTLPQRYQQERTFVRSTAVHELVAPEKIIHPSLSRNVPQLERAFSDFYPPERPPSTRPPSCCVSSKNETPVYCCGGCTNISKSSDKCHSCNAYIVWYDRTYANVRTVE